MLKETSDADINSVAATRRARGLSREISFAVMVTAAAAMAAAVGASYRDTSETVSIANVTSGLQKAANTR